MVDCYSKVIQFNSDGNSSYEFVGNKGGPSTPLITSIEVERLLKEGCQGYLAMVKDIIIEEPNLEDITVVQDFADVFLKELQRLPPERKMEFVVELALGTESVSKASY